MGNRTVKAYKSDGMGRYLKRFWKENTLTILVLAVLCGIQVGANILMMWSFQGIIDRDMNRFLFWMLLLVAVWFLIHGLSGLETWLRCRGIRCMNNAIRQDIAKALLRKSYLEFHGQSVGDYLALFTNDISQIESLAWNPFFDCIRSAVTVIFSIAALLSLHWSLLAASVATTAIMLSAPKLFHRNMERLGAVCTREQQAAVSRLKDLLSGYDVLRFFNREQLFLQGTEQASQRMEGPRFRLAYVKGFTGAGMGCVNIVCQMLHVALIGILSVRGIILQGALTGGGNLCGNLSAGLGGMVQNVLSMSSAKPYFQKLPLHMEQIAIDGADRAAEGIGGMEPEIAGKKIAMEQVGFCYGEKTVLQNFSACFEAGGKYALTGPSGCGKSTLLMLLLGCLPGYTGSVRLGGRELSQYRPEQLWRQIGYIQQDVFLFDATIRDNLTLGEEFSEDAIQKALRDSALEENLRSMPRGLDTVAGENGGNLSGGQRQRVAIARALLHSRSILLVDEGTSALDRENADIIERNLLSRPELTLILVSHHLSPERKAQFTRVFTLPGLGGS
nr:ABC transporter ATP-binding protein [uncultured Acetatifactor sp.]